MDISRSEAIMSDTPGLIPGYAQILAGVNVKTAAWADVSSIGTRLYDEGDSSKWATQQLQYGQNTYTYRVPPGFQVATINDYAGKDFVGQDRDEYMTSLLASFKIDGSYGAFSGTINAQFSISENQTQAYSFGTHAQRLRWYSLKTPAGLDSTNPLLNQAFVKELLDDSKSVSEFYNDWGTHFTSDIIIGGAATLSIYSQYTATFDKETFELDLGAAYESVAASFKTSGEFQYTGQSSKESYTSNKSLVIQGGDPTAADTLEDWLKTVVETPVFLDVNQSDPSYSGLTPMYELISDDNSPRKKALKQGLDDYLYPPLHLRIFAAASTLTQFPEATVSVPAKYKVLSGGARVVWNGTLGEMLTASFPVSDSQWTARAHDASQQDTGILTVFAIGVYDPYDWLDVVIVNKTSDSTSERPSVQVALDTSVDTGNALTGYALTGYALTGGGADCKGDSSTNNPIYLTASYPYSEQDIRGVKYPSNVWKAIGKDAFVQANGSITAYAVGVKWSDTFTNKYGNRTRITTWCIGLDSQNDSHPAALVGPPDQTSLVGGGAYDRWDAIKGAEGNMLTDSYPANLVYPYHADSSKWSAAGKDHIKSSPAVLTVYAIGAENMVTP
jgi:hypothetical protein